MILPNARINASRPARDQLGVSPMVFVAVQAYIGLAGGGMPVQGWEGGEHYVNAA